MKTNNCGFGDFGGSGNFGDIGGIGMAVSVIRKLAGMTPWMARRAFGGLSAGVATMPDLCCL